MRRNKKGLRKLDATEWAVVFRLRCRVKDGEMLLPEEQDFIDRALAEDAKRYAALEHAIKATKP